MPFTPPPALLAFAASIRREAHHPPLPPSQDRLPDRLEDVRRQLGLNPAEMSRLLGYNHNQHYHAIQKGGGAVNSRTLERFCRRLDVSADWLMGLSDTQRRLGE